MTLPLDPEKYVLSLPTTNGGTIDLAPNGVLPQWTFIVGRDRSIALYSPIVDLRGKECIRVFGDRLHYEPIRQREYIRQFDAHPNHQIIVECKSPILIQEAGLANVIMVNEHDDGILSHELFQHDFSGWTLDEILHNVFDCPTRTERYYKASRAYDYAMDNDDYAGVIEARNVLDKILHPCSTSFKFMNIEMAGLSYERDENANH